MTRRDVPTEVVRLPMPRAVKAEVRGQRRPEPQVLAVIDRVPVAVPAVQYGDAPLVLRLAAKGGIGRQSWRAYDGALWRPFLSTDDIGATPTEAARRLEDRARLALDAGHRGDATMRQGERLLPMVEALRDCERKAGVAAFDEHRVRRVVDDGMAGRAAMVERAGRDLIIVNGRLHHRAPAPGYVLRGAEGTDGWLRLEGADPYLDPVETPAKRGAAWAVFAPHRVGEADAVLGAIPALDWFQEYVDSPRVRRFDVFEPDLIARMIPEPTLADFVSGCFSDYLAHCGSGIHAFSDDAVSAYLDARRARTALSEGGDPEAAFETLRALVGILGEEEPEAAPGRPGRLSLAGRCMLLRNDLVERPRNGLPPIEPGEDMRALAGLGR